MPRIETVDAGFAWTESFLKIDRGAYRPRGARLARMRRLLELAGDPHRSGRIVHVAGSKGKGSTSAFLAHILAERARAVGLYTSPHVVSYRERIRIVRPATVSGREDTFARLRDPASDAAPDDLLLSCFATIEAIVARLRGSVRQAELPTPFELVTLLGFLAFARHGCEAAVIETGIGGRIDATNVVDPVVSVVTRIELEHTDFLGTTYRAVASEKAGIIKRDRPVVVARQEPDAQRTIERVAALRRASVVRIADEVDVADTHVSPEGTTISLSLADGSTADATLRLAGAPQASNAALALVASRIVDRRITLRDVQTGLERAWLPGRGEIVSGSPRVLLDGAHTSESIALVCETARALSPHEPPVAIFGSVAGKDFEGMLRPIVSTFGGIVIARPGTFKPSDVHTLVEACRRLGGSCVLEPEPRAAFARALELSGPQTLIVVTGSFYLVGEIRAVIADFSDGAEAWRR